MRVSLSLRLSLYVAKYDYKLIARRDIETKSVGDHLCVSVCVLSLYKIQTELVHWQMITKSVYRLLSPSNK